MRALTRSRYLIVEHQPSGVTMEDNDRITRFNASEIAYSRGKYDLAAKILTSLAADGDARSQNVLGVMYGSGVGVEKDMASAFSLYLKAAELNYAEGQINLGRCYLEGRGVTQDIELGVSWIRKAADAGS